MSTADVNNCMSLFTHRKRQTIFKAILLLAYIALFGSQLSHKFYICANFLTHSYKRCHCATPHIRPTLHGNSSIADQRRAALLSLDKRYELKPVFGLITPSFQLGIVSPDVKKEFALFCPSSYSCIPVIPSLRAPPSFIDVHMI